MLFTNGRVDPRMEVIMDVHGVLAMCASFTESKLRGGSKKKSPPVVTREMSTTTVVQTADVSTQTSVTVETQTDKSAVSF